MSASPATARPDENVTGCIEDRVVVSELNIFQLPGGDAFLSAAKDIITTTDDDNAPGKFIDSVLRDNDQADHYTLHRDEDHGDFYDGCGFLARQADIYHYLSNKVLD